MVTCEPGSNNSNCNVPGLNVNANVNGNVNANDDSWNCEVNNDGNSECEEK